MSKFKNTPVRMNIMIDKDIRKKYKQLCLKKDMVMSDRIRELIEIDLKQWKQ
jgi:hypothetical protein